MGKRSLRTPLCCPTHHNPAGRHNFPQNLSTCRNPHLGRIALFINGILRIILAYCRCHPIIFVGVSSPPRCYRRCSPPDSSPHHRPHLSSYCYHRPLSFLCSRLFPRRLPRCYHSTNHFMAKILYLLYLHCIRNGSNHLY